MCGWTARATLSPHGPGHGIMLSFQSKATTAVCLSISKRCRLNGMGLFFLHARKSLVRVLQLARSSSARNLKSVTKPISSRSRKVVRRICGARGERCTREGEGSSRAKCLSEPADCSLRCCAFRNKKQEPEKFGEFLERRNFSRAARACKADEELLLRGFERWLAAKAPQLRKEFQ